MTPKSVRTKRRKHTEKWSEWRENIKFRAEINKKNQLQNKIGSWRKST